jgi:hypothetical protein
MTAEPGVSDQRLNVVARARVRWTIRSPIVHRHLHQDVDRRGLGVFDLDVEVAVVVEHAGIDQLELGLVLATASVLIDQLCIGEGRLRVLVEELEVGVGRRRIEIVVKLLDVLAVIALAVGQPEQPFLENQVAAVPQPQSQTEALLLVADPAEPVLPPPIRARARLIVA